MPNVVRECPETGPSALRQGVAIRLIFTRSIPPKPGEGCAPFTFIFSCHARVAILPGLGRGELRVLCILCDLAIAWQYSCCAHTCCFCNLPVQVARASFIKLLSAVLKFLGQPYLNMMLALAGSAASASRQNAPFSSLQFVGPYCPAQVQLTLQRSMSSELRL